MKNIPFPLVQGILIILLIITAAISTTSNPTPSIQPTSTDPAGVLASTSVPALTATPYPEDVVRLAWFYKPPDSTQMDLVAQQADFFILTHKDENDRSQLRTRGITTPFSQYLLFTEIHDPSDCEDRPTGNQVAYKAGDFCQISEFHPDWFLLEEDGDRVGDEDSYFMDPGNAGFRAFWLERARELQETHGWETIFLDNVEASRAKFVDDDDEPLTNYPDDESYQRAVAGFLDYIRQNYFQPRGKPMYANIVSVDDYVVWDEYLHYLDGVMIESYATDWDEGYLSVDDWEKQMEQAEKALSMGKTLILVAQGQQDDQELQKFAFASYLLLANGNAYFRYANSDAYRDWWMYENYNVDPGLPVGPRYQYQGGWRRDFAKGYVIVNPQDRAVEIVFTSP